MVKKNQPIPSETKRIDFSKISGTLELPYLVRIQTDSFRNFVEEGIVEVFNDIYPIVAPSGNIELNYLDSHFEEPKYSIEECKDRDMTYAKPLKVRLGLFDNSEHGEIKVSEVFMGDFPWMTDSGTFIINGAERVIVSQLVRSPGVYFSKERDKSGKFVFGGDIIPGRGTWLQFETDAKGLINVRIDRNRKVSATTLLRALGLTGDVKDLFGDCEQLRQTIEKDNTMSEMLDREDIIRAAMIEIYNRLRPGEPATEEGARTLLFQKFFDARRYDLAKAGRFKFKKKLGLYNRLLDRVLAEDLCDENGEPIYRAGTHIGKEELADLRERKVFEKGAHNLELQTNTAIEDGDTSCRTIVQKILVYSDESREKVLPIIGTDLTIEKRCLTIADIIAAFSYYVNIIEGIGDTDDIDHLGNRRVKTVGELLQNQFRIGLSRMERSVKERMTIAESDKITAQNLTNIRPLTSSIKEFFSSSQLSQFMDQTNPFSEITHKRRLSALGPGGLTRERAGFEVRDVHYSHYGRICPIETPEGPNIGLIGSLSIYARINNLGFIETPYRKVENGKVTDKIIYLTADEEDQYKIAQINIKIDDNHKITQEGIPCRYRDVYLTVSPEEVDFIDVAPDQMVSISASLIPFLDHDDANRALMGTNMQRQAVPVIKAETPLVMTGMESKVARDSGTIIIAEEDGVVEKVDSRNIIVKNNQGKSKEYILKKFHRSNQGTCINQKPIVKEGQKITKNMVMADGHNTEQGFLSLGRNILVAYMCWEGYNFEDAIVISEKLVQEDTFTSIHISEHECAARDTKLGPEEITADIPNIGESSLANLDEDGVIRIGTEVEAGDILVGKVTPKGETELGPEERLLRAIFGEKAREVRDTSLRVPHGDRGKVIDIKVFSRENGDEIPPGVNKMVKVFIAQKRKISEGDKISGRHGNKGVIAKILPVNDMPFLPDGTPIDIILNPLGVPSRMNVGQILELHLGWVAKMLRVNIITPVFNGATEEDISKALVDAGLSQDGKIVLYDGRTGLPFKQKVSVGYSYILKLIHLVDDKIHARSTGPYSLVTQQPLGGKAQFGGQRFGEMEVWALEGYGAAYNLQEMLTVKSDDVTGRIKTYESIVKGENIPVPGTPESFKVLIRELRSLCLNIKVLDHDGKEIEIKEDLDTRDRIDQDFIDYQT